MAAWSSYSLADLAMFSADSYLRLFELNNTALWPLPPLMAAASLALPALTREASAKAEIMIALLLGLAWCLVAWGFLDQRYAQINTAASWFALAFAAEGLLLFVAAAMPGVTLSIKGWRCTTACYPGLALLLYALLCHPMIGILAGRSWRGVEIFGIAPDPTALGTLGILLMAHGLVPRLLSLLPLAWCLVSALTSIALQQPHGLWTPAAALAALVCTAVLQRPKQ
jgi:hypothetical protein